MGRSCTGFCLSRACSRAERQLGYFALSLLPTETWREPKKTAEPSPPSPRPGGGLNHSGSLLLYLACIFCVFFVVVTPAAAVSLEEGYAANAHHHAFTLALLRFYAYYAFIRSRSYAHAYTVLARTITLVLTTLTLIIDTYVLLPRRGRKQ